MICSFLVMEEACFCGMVIGFTDYLLASLLLWEEPSRWPRLGYVSWRQQSRQNGDRFVPEV